MPGSLDPDKLIALARARDEVRRLEDELGLAPPPGAPGDAGPAIEEHKLWRLLSDHAGDMMSVHAANGDYLFASPSSERLFGWRPEQLVGQNAYAFFHEEDLARIAASHASQAEDDPDFHRVQYRLRRPDGSWQWVESRSESHIGPTGIEQIVCITRDISAARALEEELRDSNDRLQRFAGIAAHDLKGPLTTIAGSAELVRLLAEDRLTPSERGRLEQIEGATWRLAELIDKLLAWASIESTDSRPVLTDLRALARQVVAELEADVQQSEAVVEVGALPELECEPALTAMLLQNLVGNALKFRRPGVAPRVQIDAQEADAAWRIRVRDNGPGVPPEARDRIFAMFQRGGADAPGHGIGLAMCARIAQKQGGRIWVEGNQQGVGSTFVVELPRLAG